MFIKKSLLLIAASFLLQTANAHYLSKYIGELKSNCNSIKTLAVKKSVIALTRSTAHKCDDTYSKIVIKSCGNKVTCSDLYSWLNKAKSSYGGHIIGAN